MHLGKEGGWVAGRPSWALETAWDKVSEDIWLISIAQFTRSDHHSDHVIIKASHLLNEEK